MRYFNYIVLICAILNLSTAQAQFIFYDDFESYNEGDYIGESSMYWTTWSGTTGTDEDGVISSDYSYSGDNSLHIFGTVTGGPMDVYLPIGLNDPTFINFKILVPSGYSAYLNIQEDIQPLVGWAFDLFFQSNGFLVLSVDQNEVTEFGPSSFIFDEWNEISLQLDPLVDLAKIYINNQLVGQIPFEYQIGGLNLFGYGDGNTEVNYYVDDVAIISMESFDSESEEQNIPDCSELFISEYFEGSGNNKGVEFYNPTSEYIDLSEYTLSRYANGSSAPTDQTQLDDVLAPYSTWVLVNGQTEDVDLGGGNISPACDPILQDLADQLDNPYPAPTFFNGNDALVLTKNGEIIDVFGKVGEDPGYAWTDDPSAGYTDYNGGDWITANHTLRRKYLIGSGITENPLEFNAILEWDTLEIDNWEGIGYHECFCYQNEEEEEEEQTSGYVSCTEGYDFGDIQFGFYPDPEQNQSFEDGNFENEYFEALHMILPTDVSVTDPTLPPGILLDSLVLTNFSIYNVLDSGYAYSPNELGLNYDCHNNGDSFNQCTFLGGNQYCISIEGSPTMSGDFYCVIEVTSYIYAPIIGLMELPMVLEIDLFINDEEPNFIEGCTDEEACNYNPEANENDGSCEYTSCLGCTDEEAMNYDEEATIEDGSCIYINLNCDTLGDEGWGQVDSGIFPETSTSTFGINTTLDLVLHVNDMIEDPASGQIFEFINFEMTSVEGLPLGIESDITQTQITPVDQLCITLSGAPYEYGIFNVQFTGVATISLFGLELELNNFSFSHLLLIQENPNPVLGCIYEGASNYNPSATQDDGSCELDGCTDPLAINYNSIYTVDNGSCIFNGVNPDCLADINFDGVISIEDLLMILSDFGSICDQ